MPNKSLDASGGGVFLNLLSAAEGALIRAAASTQTLDRFTFMSLPKKFYLSNNVPAVMLIPENEANNFVYELQCNPDGGAVRVIRGWKCPNYDALHNEVAAALQFPGYYGENWDAMDECITDLAWMPAQWYLIHVNGVELVLPEDEKNFSIFLKVLHRAGLDFAHPESRGLADGEAALSKPFNTIISGSEEGLLRARKALDLDDPGAAI